MGEESCDACTGGPPSGGNGAKGSTCVTDGAARADPTPGSTTVEGATSNAGAETAVPKTFEERCRAVNITTEEGCQWIKEGRTIDAAGLRQRQAQDHVQLREVVAGERPQCFLWGASMPRGRRRKLARQRRRQADEARREAAVRRAEAHRAREEENAAEERLHTAVSTERTTADAAGAAASPADGGACADDEAIARELQHQTDMEADAADRHILREAHFDINHDVVTENRTIWAEATPLDEGVDDASDFTAVPATASRSAAAAPEPTAPPARRGISDQEAAARERAARDQGGHREEQGGLAHEAS